MFPKKETTYIGSGAGLGLAFIITIIIILYKLKCLNCYNSEPSTNSAAETGIVLRDNSSSSDTSEEEEEEIVHYELPNLSGDVDTRNILSTRLRSE